MKHYKKELIYNRILGPDGKIVEFEHVGGQIGVLALDPEKSPELVKYLDQMAAEHRLGVSVITPEEYEEAKKKAQSLSSTKPTPSDTPLRVASRLSPFDVLPKKSAIPSPSTFGIPDAAVAGADDKRPPGPMFKPPGVVPPSPQAKESSAKRFRPKVAPAEDSATPAGHSEQ